MVEHWPEGVVNIEGLCSLTEHKMAFIGKGMIRFTDQAKEKVKQFIEANKKPNATLRIKATRNQNDFAYHFALEDYENERASDTLVREGGFVTRLDPESAGFLKGATIDWLEKEGKTGFSVDNPNKPKPPGSEEEMKEAIIAAIKTIYDPEIPAVDIHDLGLIYDVKVDPEFNIDVTMTLTAPNCPAAEQLPADVERKSKAVSGVKSVKVNLVFEPAWTPERMSDAAKLELNIT